MIKVYNKKIQINNKSIIFDTTIKKIIYFSDIFVVLIRENKEIPNNIIAYNYYGNEVWKINDIVCAKVLRGYDNIIKKSENVLVAYCELGMIFEIDIFKKIVIHKNYMR